MGRADEWPDVGTVCGFDERQRTWTVPCGELACSRMAYGTDGGSSSRCAIVPLGRLVTVATGDAEAAGLRSCWSVAEDESADDDDMKQFGMHWSMRRAPRGSGGT